ncbi:MAG TPA: hypothetical protein VNF06_00715 [Candidatus Aquilonibacter sp.]|nr:hypothetical protein [Candidatus Aquilonibacter sp.]
MIGILFSIGAINALIPIIVILILIAAAAGSTRGSKLFEMFGISALLGMSVGKGTLQKQSPFKSKKFKSDTNPFRKFGNAGINAAKNKAQQTLSKAAMTSAHGVSFDNLGRSGPSASGSSPGTISEFARKQYAGVESKLGERGLSSTLSANSGRVKTAINQNYGKIDRAFEKKKLAALNHPTMTDSQKSERLADLKSSYNKAMFEVHKKFAGDLAGINNISKNTTPPPPPWTSLRDHFKVLKFQHLVDKKKESVLELNRLNTQSTKDFSSYEKMKFTPQRLQRQRDKEAQKLAETAKEIDKMERAARRDPNLTSIFDRISNSSGSTIRKDSAIATVNEVLGRDLNSEIMDTKKFLKAHKKFVI